MDYGISQSFVHGATAMEPVNMPSSMENPSFNLDDPGAYDLLSDGGATSSGIRVSPTKALTHPAVHQALDLISGDIASIPLELFVEEADGDCIVQSKHSLYNLIRWQPNERMNAFRFWRRLIAWKLLWSNSYAWLRRRGDGAIVEMIPLLPDRTGPELIDGELFYVTEVEGKLVPMLPEEVFHLEGLPMDTLSGYDFIKSSRDAIGLALGAMDFASKFYKNGGRVGGILELPSNMPKSARDKVEKGFRTHYSSNDAFKTVVLRDNAKFHQAQMSPEQAQVVDARRESVRDIARFFNLRPGKLGEESKNSFASKAEDNRDHYDTTLRPHCYEITQECRNKLLTTSEKQSGHFFRHDTRELLRMDFGSMSEAISTLRSSEVINSNQARRMLDMNKRDDPGGDDYANPNTKSNAAPTTSPDPKENDQATNAFRSLLSSTVQRMASGVAKRAKSHATDPQKFCDWLDEKYMNQKSSIAAAIGEVLSAAAIAIDSIEDASVVSEQITNEFLTESHQILQTITASATLPELRKVVDANMDEWSAAAGERYANQFI
ncbi:phage portal protein [Rhodopirellula bahusiensis]|uniref:phage portal protein n=2 Tax=Rhodopirellula bahusiensis TaxID=2014065 RepID=UPI003263A880